MQDLGYCRVKFIRNDTGSVTKVEVLYDDGLIEVSEKKV